MAMPERKYDDALLHDPAFDGGLPQSLIMGTGSGASSTTTLLTAAEDNFTVELWVKPTATHEIDAENAYGISGVSGQKFVIDPVHSGNNTSIAGMGISVGTNGVSVYEHADYYMPALLVWESPTPLTAWTHIAVVYENRQPRLYINGVLVHTGLTSIKTHVYPGNLVASGAYGTMEGQVDEVRVWDHVLTQAQITTGMNSTAQAPQAGLTAYWPIRQSDSTVLQDISGNNHPVQLNGSYSAANWSSDAAALQSYNKNSYRYAFNGKEKDSDIDQDDYDYGMRIYDAKIGKFLSVDPLGGKYPFYTPYSFAGNKPIQCVDLDGAEESIPYQQSTSFDRIAGTSPDLYFSRGIKGENLATTLPEEKKNGLEAFLNSINPIQISPVEPAPHIAQAINFGNAIGSVVYDYESRMNGDFVSYTNKASAVLAFNKTVYLQVSTNGSFGKQIVENLRSINGLKDLTDQEIRDYMGNVKFVFEAG